MAGSLEAEQGVFEAVAAAERVEEGELAVVEGQGEGVVRVAGMPENHEMGHFQWVVEQAAFEVRPPLAHESCCNAGMSPLVGNC